MIFDGFWVAEPRTRRKTVADCGEPMDTRKSQGLGKNPGFSKPQLTRGKPVETRKKKDVFFNGSEGSRK